MHTKADLNISLHVRIHIKIAFLFPKILELLSHKVCKMLVYKHTAETRKIDTLWANNS